MTSHTIIIYNVIIIVRVKGLRAGGRAAAAAATGSSSSAVVVVWAAGEWDSGADDDSEEPPNRWPAAVYRERVSPQRIRSSARSSRASSPCNAFAHRRPPSHRRRASTPVHVTRVRGPPETDVSTTTAVTVATVAPPAGAMDAAPAAAYPGFSEYAGYSDDKTTAASAAAATDGSAAAADGPADDGKRPRRRPRTTVWTGLRAVFEPSMNRLSMKIYGSEKAVLKERLRQRSLGAWVIHPCSKFR